jgi:hypothetical protein
MAAIPFVFNAIAASGVGPESGAKAYTYVKDTATPLAVYTDTALTTPASNPVVANSLGYMVFYINSTLNYTITIKTANDATTLLQVTYTASGSVIAVTGGTVPNYNSLVSAIDAQLNFQPIDDDLTAYAGLTGTGFVKRTGSGTASTVGETGTGVVVLANGATVNDLIIGGTTPRLNFIESDAPTDEKYFSIVSDAGRLFIQSRNDSGTFGENIIAIDRTGTDGTQVQINAPVVISTDENTTEVALTIDSSGPLSGTTPGPFKFNYIFAEWSSGMSGTGGPGEDGSASLTGTVFQLNVGGPNYDGLVAAFAVAVSIITTDDDSCAGDKTAFSTGLRISHASPGKGYAGASAVTVEAGGESPQVLTWECDLAINTPDGVINGGGINSWSWGAYQATNTYSAYLIGVSGAPGAAKWKSGIKLYTNEGGDGDTPQPIDTDGNLIDADNPGTLGSLIYLPDWDVDAYHIKTLNLEIDGAGRYNGATIDELGWSSHTPAISSAGGSITTSSTSGQYRRLFGRTIVYRGRVTLTTVGTATGALQIDLPVDADTTNSAVLYGREVGTTGKGVAGTIQSADLVNCIFVDAASVFTGGNGTIVDFEIIYEAAA